MILKTGAAALRIGVSVTLCARMDEKRESSYGFNMFEVVGVGTDDLTIKDAGRMGLGKTAARMLIVIYGDSVFGIAGDQIKGVCGSRRENFWDREFNVCSLGL